MLRGWGKRCGRGLAAAVLFGGLWLTAGYIRAAALSPEPALLPQDVLTQALRRQREIAFIGERTQTEKSSDPDKEDTVFRQRIFHNPPSAYRIDFLDLPDDRELHVLAVDDRLYEWGRDNRVWVRERSDNQTLGLVISDTYIDLLRKNYLVRAELGPEVADRRTYAVRIDPHYPGRPAIRAWVDSTYGVPLKVEVYTPQGDLRARWEYSRIAFRSRLDAARFSPPGPTEQRLPARGVECTTPGEFLNLTGLHPPLADRLPAGFTLAEIRLRTRRSPEGEKWFIQSFYSDGYASFSLFTEEDPEHAPEGVGETGIRYVRSGQRGWYYYATGWMGTTKVTVTGDIAEAELLEVLSSVNLEGYPPRVP